jgi:membrane-associated phospholipid phosphatase
MQSANDNPIALHVEAAKREGINLNPERLQECWDLAGEAVHHIKEIWKVKRPFEVDSKIKGLVSTKSYSFPSANAAGTFFIAKKVAEEFPQLKESQMAVANKIANSRVQAGVHYPLDIEVGKMLALGLL